MYILEIIDDEDIVKMKIIDKKVGSILKKP